MSTPTQYFSSQTDSEFHNQGRVELIIGPMFSGKTTELIRRITRFRFAKKSCLVIKYAADQRYSKGDIATHDERFLTAVRCSRLEEHMSKAQEHDVIGIDEGQFFPDIVKFCEELANQGKVLVVAALDGTFKRQGFGGIPALVPLAESVIKLHAVCMVCCKSASFTKRVSDEDALEVIGSTEKYMAVCRMCFYEGSSNSSKQSNGLRRPLTPVTNENIISPKKIKC